MTRIPRIIAALAALALVALLPGTAAARSHHRHAHVRSHARQHRARVRMLAPATTSGDAGTIASFTGGVLTITLANGDSVHGTVTPDTEIECSTPGAGDQQDDQGDDSGDTQQSSTTTARAADDNSGDTSGDDSGDTPGDDSGDTSGDSQSGDSQMACDSSALTPGAAVHEAELKITNAGAVFEKVEVVLP